MALFAYINLVLLFTSNLISIQYCFDKKSHSFFISYFLYCYDQQSFSLNFMFSSTQISSKKF